LSSTTEQRRARQVGHPRPSRSNTDHFQRAGDHARRAANKYDFSARKNGALEEAHARNSTIASLKAESSQADEQAKLLDDAKWHTLRASIHRTNREWDQEQARIIHQKADEMHAVAQNPAEIPRALFCHPDAKKPSDIPSIVRRRIAAREGYFGADHNPIIPRCDYRNEHTERH